VKANHRIAMAYKETKKLDEARKHIKRIVIWQSTPKEIKDLYKELLKKDQKLQEREDVS